MLFNSIEYIFIFLPLVVVAFFLLNKLRYTKVAVSFLALASLFFYAYWRPIYLPILLVSIIFNYVIGKYLGRCFQSGLSASWGARCALWGGVLVNVSALCYYKYTNFAITTINALADEPFFLQQDITLPLAISFFTFQQIAYLVDSYRGLTHEYHFSNYVLFVAFFPQLIAGPIVHHKEMMPQFANMKAKIFNWRNFYLGLYIFFVGLFKKNVIADNLAAYVNCGYNFTDALSFFEGWLCSLSYSFQLYFDFSGYCDMAIGSALILNIHLPFNFKSPYKARNIQDFWRRWHITLSRFLRDYVYIPLGGNRHGTLRTYLNLFLVFVVGGIWHGAGWGFIVWGALHGLAIVTHRMWTNTRIHLPKALAIALTFLFVNFTWIFFRAPNLTAAFNVIKSMLGMNGMKFGYPLVYNKLPALDSLLGRYNFLRHFFSGELSVFYRYGSLSIKYLLLLLTVSFFVAGVMPNSNSLLSNNKTTSYSHAAILALIIFMVILSRQTISEFIYFNF